MQLKNKFVFQTQKQTHTMDTKGSTADYIIISKLEIENLTFECSDGVKLIVITFCWIENFVSADKVLSDQL